MTRPIRCITLIAVLALLVPRTTVTQVAAPAIVGRWVGEATIAVNWTRRRVLPIDITICRGDTVYGTVGDASLAGARLERSDAATEKTQYFISANLDGAIIRAENVWRPSVRIGLNSRDTILEGILTTPGWRMATVERKAIAATVVLRRVPVVVLTVRTRAQATEGL
jgi:hypothetical protein